MAKRTKRPEYPKKLYMKWDGDGDDSFLNESEDFNDLAIMNDGVSVAEYELKKLVYLKNTTEIV